MSGAWFSPGMMLRIEAKQFNLGFIRPENLVSHSLIESFRCFFANSKQAFMSFTEERLPSSHSAIKPRSVECCCDGWPAVSPISTQDLWSLARMSIRYFITSLTMVLLPRVLSLAGHQPLGKVLVVPNFFDLRMMEATVLFGTFNAAAFLL